MELRAAGDVVPFGQLAVDDAVTIEEDGAETAGCGFGHIAMIEQA